MTMFKQLLLPTDFSPLANCAAHFARTLAECCGARIHVLHVRAIAMPAMAVPEMGLAMVPPPAIDDDSPRRLDDFVARQFEGARVPIVTAVRDGETVDSIVGYARAEKIDLIVIGTHSRGLLNRLLMGSVSESVVEHSRCAVLMVPPGVDVAE